MDPLSSMIIRKNDQNWVSKTNEKKNKKNNKKKKTEDHWSCIAHLCAEDMLKSAVIEEKKFKHSPLAGADVPLGPKF